MKRFLAVLCVVFSAITIASAQDIIVLKDSQRIDAKIVSVTSTEVSYKKANYTDGPTFTLNVSEIATIIYSNGDTQVFNTAPESTRSTAPVRTNSESRYTVESNSSSVSQKTSSGFKFNPEPSGNRPFGISIGYVSKQTKDVEDGDKYPWLYLGDKDYKKSSASLRLGLYWAPEFRYGLGLQTGLYYELSTSSYKEDDYKLTGSEHTLSVPVRLQYRYEIIPDLSVFLYTGPSFDISLAYNAKESYDGETEKYSLYEDGDVNRFNMLWGVGAGVRWKQLQLMLGGDWGLTNLYKDSNWKETLSKPFHISLTYLF